MIYIKKKKIFLFVFIYNIRILIYLLMNNEIKNCWFLVYIGVERIRYWGNIVIFVYIF